MNTGNMHIAKLDDQALQQLHALEQQLGTSVVALQPDPGYADLNEDQLKALQAAEQALGRVLIAYDTH